MKSKWALPCHVQSLHGSQPLILKGHPLPYNIYDGRERHVPLPTPINQSITSHLCPPTHKTYISCTASKYWGFSLDEPLSTSPSPPSHTCNRLCHLSNPLHYFREHTTVETSITPSQFLKGRVPQATDHPLVMLLRVQVVTINTLPFLHTTFECSHYDIIVLDDDQPARVLLNQQAT